MSTDPNTTDPDALHELAPGDMAVKDGRQFFPLLQSFTMLRLFGECSPWPRRAQLVLAPGEPQPDAPTDIARLPDYWDERRRRQGKPDLSRCAAELRLALAAAARGAR